MKSSVHIKFSGNFRGTGFSPGPIIVKWNFYDSLHHQINNRHNISNILPFSGIFLHHIFQFCYIRSMAVCTDLHWFGSHCAVAAFYANREPELRLVQTDEIFFQNRNAKAPAELNPSPPLWDVWILPSINKMNTKRNKIKKKTPNRLTAAVTMASTKTAVM